MKLMDKTKTTSTEDMNSHYDYLIDKGIMKTVKQTQKDFRDTGKFEVRSDWFLELPEIKQTELITLHTDNWWRDYSKVHEQSIKINTDIPDNPFDDVYDYEDDLYVDDNDDDDDNLTDEEWEDLQEYIDEKDKEIEENRIKKLTNKLIDEDSLVIDTIKKNIQKRRRDGGCSMWRNVGLKWIYDNNRFDLLKYKWEKDYIDKHYRRINEE